MKKKRVPKLMKMNERYKMTEKHRVGNADMLMIITCFLWGMGNVVCKNSYGNTPESFRVMIFNGIRFPIATLLLFISIKFSDSNARIRLEHVPGIALVSFFGMFLFIVLFHFGLSMTTASNAGIIIAVIPLVIVLISFLHGTERPTKWLISGIIVGFCGVLLMNYQNGIFIINKGDFLVLISSICWSIYAVYGKKFMDIYSPMTVTAWIFLFTSIYLLPVLIYQAPGQSWTTVSGWNWVNLGFATVGPLFVANVLYYTSIHKIGPSHSGIYINLEPVFTVLLAYLIRNENIYLYQLIGLLVIIFGVSISKIRSKRAI